MKIISLKDKPLFLKKMNIKRIFEFASIEGFNVWIVGGAVRDHLLLRETKDIDFVYDIEPIKLLTLLKNNNFEVNSNFINYGTLIITLGNDLFHLTSLREDYDNDGRHSKVKFTKKLKIDSLRRDLTINALYLNKKNEIIDFHNGFKDLRHSKIKFVGNIKKKCIEDNLRILRYCRFCSIYDKPLIPVNHINFLKENSFLLKNISKVKVKCEFEKIFVNQYFENSLVLIKHINLDEYFINDLGFKSKFSRKNFNKKILHYNLNYFTFE